MLTNSQKIDVRRHLGYPVAGLLQLSPAGGTVAQGAVGYRFFQAYGFLEYKMNALNPAEEAALLGTAVGAISMTGPQPNPGDQISVTLSGGVIPSPQTLTVTAPAALPGQDMRVTLLQALSGACSLNATLQAAGVYSATPYGLGPLSMGTVPFPEISFVSPQTFTMTASGTGLVYPTIQAQGQLVPPAAQLLSSRGATTNGYIPILNGLEGAIAGSSQNLDTLKADVWQGRSNEIGQRTSLYKQWQQMLSNFLGTAINPQRRNDPGRGVGALAFA